MLKGFRTIGFGLLMILLPPALTYLGGVDWTSLGINPAVSAAIGAIIIGLRAMTNTPIGRAAVVAVGAPLAGLALLAGCSSATQTDIASALASLGATPAGANLIAWVQSMAPKAEAEIVKFNASLPGGGLTLADVKDVCGADNTVHGLIQAVELFAPLPGELVTADQLGYEGIQDLCALATAGTLPNAAQIGSLLSAWNAVAGIATQVAAAPAPPAAG